MTDKMSDQSLFKDKLSSQSPSTDKASVEPGQMKEMQILEPPLFFRPLNHEKIKNFPNGSCYGKFADCFDVRDMVF